MQHDQKHNNIILLYIWTVYRSINRRHQWVHIWYFYEFDSTKKWEQYNNTESHIHFLQYVYAYAALLGNMRIRIKIYRTTVSPQNINVLVFIEIKVDLLY